MRERRFGEKGGVGVTRIQMSTPEASSSGNRAAEWETSTDDFESVLICALRYCLGRQTYMPSIVIAFIRPMLSVLSAKALSVIVRDIENAKGGVPGLGDPNIDEPLWLNLLNAAKAELEGRKGMDE